MKPQEYKELQDRVHAFRQRHGHRFETRYKQPPPPFTVFTLLYWIAVTAAVVTPLLGFLLYALGLLEFRR